MFFPSGENNGSAPSGEESNVIDASWLLYAMFLLFYISRRLRLDPHFWSRRFCSFGLALAQHRIRGACPRLRRRGPWRWTILGHFIVATGVIYPTADLDCVLPDPVLHLFGPRRLKFLLADGTGSVAECGIVRGPDPRLGRLLFGGAAISSCTSFRSGLNIRRTLIVADLSGFDPIL